MTVTRLQAGETPRKTERPGYVETPGTYRKTRSRKSGVSNLKDDDSDVQDSSTGLEDETTTHRAGLTRRPKAAKTTHKEVVANGNANGFADGTSHVKQQSNQRQELKPNEKVKLPVHYEFGGSWGVSCLMVGFPALMYYMWIGATYYDGKLPMPSPGQTWSEFGASLGRLVYTGAYPSLKAWTMYWSFAIFQVACYYFMPGIWCKGKPLPHENNRQLDYYCSGMWSWWTTIILSLTLHITGLFRLYEIVDEFGPVMSVAIISGFLVSIALFVSAHIRGKTHRMTGYPVYDFFMGAELNPRLFGIVDLKMLFEVRIPWFILFLVSLATAARQYEQYGYVSSEVAFILMAHFLYANACGKGEECITNTWDMYYEKLGFMLTFWNIAGVPLSYCHCAIYLANHPPSEYAKNKYVMGFMFVTYLCVYYVWDTTNSQKNLYRMSEAGKMPKRKTFPQLPWAYVENPKIIRTENGGTILADGWYGYARKIHYTCDTYFAITWALVCGFQSPFPWFYPIFFVIMIGHRAMRDIQKCRITYGKAWLEYEKQVPYLFIPLHDYNEIIMAIGKVASLPEQEYTGGVAAEVA